MEAAISLPSRPGSPAGIGDSASAATADAPGSHPSANSLAEHGGGGSVSGSGGGLNDRAAAAGGTVTRAVKGVAQGAAEGVAGAAARVRYTAKTAGQLLG